MCYTAAIWWISLSYQPNKMQSTYLSVSLGTKLGGAKTDLLMLPQGQLITTFVRDECKWTVLVLCLTCPFFPNERV